MDARTASLRRQHRIAPSRGGRRLRPHCVIDGVLEHSQRSAFGRPNVPPQSPTLGLSHLQFDAVLAAAHDSNNLLRLRPRLLGLLGLRISEATTLDITDLGEEHGNRVLRVVGKGHKIVLVPMPPAVARAVDRAIGDRSAGPILLNRCGRRMDRHAATRRLHRLQAAAGVQIARMHPYMLRHTFVTTMLDAGVDLRDTRSPPDTPTLAPRCATSARPGLARPLPTTSWPPTCHPAHDRQPELPSCGIRRGSMDNGAVRPTRAQSGSDGSRQKSALRPPPNGCKYAASLGASPRDGGRCSVARRFAVALPASV